MISSNLFETISTFSREDFKRFGDLVKSPFFNTNSTLISLYDHLKKYFPDLSHKSLQKERVFKKLFPGETYNDGRMRLLSHRMNVLAEEYLAQQGVERSDYWKKIFLLESLKSKGLFKAYDRHLMEARILNEEKNKNTNEFYFVQFTLENTNVAAQVSKNLDANERAFFKGQVNLVSKSISCFAIITILKYSLFMENIKYRLKFEPHPGLLEEVISHMQNNDYEDHPIIMVYYYLTMLIREPNNIDLYIKARDTFFRNEKDFHYVDSMNIYINLENYLWKLYRRDYTKLPDEVMILYKRRLEMNNYKLGGFMPNQIFKRIVKASLMQNDPVYADKFVHKYKKELKPEFKEAAISFANSLCSFHKKDYDEALKSLSIAYNEDISHKIDVKNQMLFILFETGRYDNLLLALDSYRHFLKNNELISEPVKNRSDVVIKFMRRLCKHKLKPDPEEADKIKKDIKKINEIENREWFTKICESL